jgi:acetyl-CoA acetyltransferase
MPVHIASAIRSPFTAVNGALAGWHPVDLAAAVMNAARQVQGSDPRTFSVDEVFVGCAEPVGAQGANMARAAILAAGWPYHVSGVVLDRAETSGTAALHAAAAAITAGTIDTAMVVGVSNASTVPPGASALARTYGRPWGDGPASRVENEGGLLPAPAAADRAAALAAISRTAQDDWATASLERRAQAAPASVIAIDARPGERVAVQRGAPITDDEPRERPTDPSTMLPSFDLQGTVTGFTFAPPADGATAIVLTREPIGPEIVGVGRSAGNPLDPNGAITSAVDRAIAGLTRADINRWEISEPTAAATLLAIAHLGIDPDLVNRNGGTLGVGDAGAAEELRLVADAIARAESGGLFLAVSHGPGGAAATLLRCP